MHIEDIKLTLNEVIRFFIHEFTHELIYWIMCTQDPIKGLLSKKQVVKVSVTRQFKCWTFKCKLILSLLTTTPEQPNPSEAKGQKQPPHPPRSWTSQKPRHPEGNMSYSVSPSNVLHVQRLFRCSDMTCLSHVIVFAGDLIYLGCIFKANVSLPCCHKTIPNTF